MKRDFINILYIAFFQIRTKCDRPVYMLWVCRVCVCVYVILLYGHSCHSSYVPVLVVRETA